MYKYIFWDWHGVLGLRGFWHIASETDPDLKDFVESVFSSQATVDSWMRGETSLAQLIHKYELNKSEHDMLMVLRHDWQEMGAINQRLFSTISSLYPGTNHIITTDNMDIFSDYAQADQFIRDNFTKIYNSYEIKALKGDAPGLFEYAMADLGLVSFKDCLLLDDSPQNCERFTSLGGESILITKGQA